MSFVRSRGLYPFTMALALISLVAVSAADEAPRKSLVGVDRLASAHLMILAVNGERIGRQGVGREEVWLPPGDHRLLLSITDRGPRGKPHEIEYDLTVEPGIDYWLHALQQGDEIFEIRTTVRD